VTRSICGNHDASDQAVTETENLEPMMEPLRMQEDEHEILGERVAEQLLHAFMMEELSRPDCNGQIDLAQDDLVEAWRSAPALEKAISANAREQDKSIPKAARRGRGQRKDKAYRN
jgi:hypothetical protein